MKATCTSTEPWWTRLLVSAEDYSRKNSSSSSKASKNSLIINLQKEATESKHQKSKISRTFISSTTKTAGRSTLWRKMKRAWKMKRTWGGTIRLNCLREAPFSTDMQFTTRFKAQSTCTRSFSMSYRTLRKLQSPRTDSPVMSSSLSVRDERHLAIN